MQLPTLLAFAAAAAGCASTRYYGVRHDQAQSVPELQRTDPPDAQAVGELRHSTTIAFFPPDSCLDRRSAPTGTQRDEQLLRLSCGTAMTDLEKAAIAAGFEVVSWQSLRGSGQPIEYAKQKNVDILFEINELDTVDVQDRDDSQRLVFFEHRGEGDSPIVVGRDVAERCRRATADPTMHIIGLSASLDVKMVAVGNGRVLWSYRTTRARDLAHTTGVRYYPAHQPRRLWAWAAIALGGTVLATQRGENASSGGQITGGLLVGVGIAGLVFRSHESPERVLCARPDVADPFAPPPQPVAPVADPGSDSYEYNAQRRERDPLAEYRLALVREIVGDFTGQLRSARGGR